MEVSLRRISPVLYGVFGGSLLLYTMYNLKEVKKHHRPQVFDRISAAEDATVLRRLRENLDDLFRRSRPAGGFRGLLESLNDFDVAKNLEIVVDTSSFTINKKTIHLCTRNPKNGFTYDINTLMFVVLHELAHVICKDVGHTPNFELINASLLDYAVSRGFYDPSRPFAKDYCMI